MTGNNVDVVVIMRGKGVRLAVAFKRHLNKVATRLKPLAAAEPFTLVQSSRS